MGQESARTLGALLLPEPWPTSVPAAHWLRADVMELVGSWMVRRFELHDALIALLGEEHAGTLMEHLLPAPVQELERLGVPVRR